MKKIIIITSLLLIIGVPSLARAVSDQRYNIENSWAYDETAECNDASSTGATAQGTSELEGHKLPAAKGGTMTEVDARGGGTAIFGKISTNDMKGPDGGLYYINMRWRYVKAMWNGHTALPGPEDQGWYTAAPRKVLVTNPRTNKSVIAVIADYGPAAWTGTPQGKDTPHPYWNDPQEEPLPDGSGYNGRVSGMTQEAIDAIEAQVWMWGGPGAGGKGSGDELLYAWADQNAPLGPTNSAVSGASASTSGSPSQGSNLKQCGGGNQAANPGDLGFEKKIAFPDLKELIQPTALVLHFTGSSNTSVDGTINGLNGNTLVDGATASVQLTVDGDGKTWQLVDPLNVKARHACSINDKALGIEIGGSGESALLANDKQFQGVVDTVVKVLKAYNIPVDGDAEAQTGLLSHQVVSESSHARQPQPGYNGKPCNGKNDPGETYMKKVREAVRGKM